MVGRMLGEISKCKLRRQSPLKEDNLIHSMENGKKAVLG
jgi:hypothetical protein